MLFFIKSLGLFEDAQAYDVCSYSAALQVTGTRLLPLVTALFQMLSFSHSSSTLGRTCWMTNSFQNSFLLPPPLSNSNLPWNGLETKSTIAYLPLKKSEIETARSTYLHYGLHALPLALSSDNRFSSSSRSCSCSHWVHWRNADQRRYDEYDANTTPVYWGVHILDSGAFTIYESRHRNQISDVSYAGHHFFGFFRIRLQPERSHQWFVAVGCTAE
jgi:hypothetical protein